MKLNNEKINVNTLGEKYIQRLPNNKFRVEIDLGYNDFGKRERFVKRCSSLSEAISVRNSVIDKVNEGRINANSNITFELLTKKFFLSSKKERAEATIQSYKCSLNNYILPYIGNIELKDITIEHLEQLYKYLRDEYQSKGKNGLSSVTLGHTHATIKVILNYAVKQSYIRENIAMKLENAPNVENNEEKEIFTKEEVQKIYQSLKKENLRFQAIVDIALTGSLRRGEIAGLNWSDIDIHNNRVTINKSVSVITGKGLVVKKPKTKSSQATVSISPNAMISLLKYREQLEQLGFELTETTPVFLSSNGKRLSPDKISHMWKKFVDSNDIPKYCFHTLRHTGLSIMYEDTGNIVAVSKHARHSRVSTTSDIYLHSNSKIDSKLAEIIDNIRSNIDASQKNENEVENEMMKKLNQVLLLLKKV